MNSHLQIEKDVPIPPIRHREGILVDTIRKMAIGDSFVFSGPKAISDATSIRHAAKRVGAKMTIRLVEGETYRAWRVQ